MSHGNAPFPYHGGKHRQAPDVWRAFGSPDVYAEPFAGSLAVLLARPAPAPGKREVVCDTDGHIVNFWRALRDAPDEVAYWADYPTFHDDLTARHRWLVETQAERGPRLREDPNWYDAKAAGWWVWGISNWIGGGWCSAKAGRDIRPYMESTGGGQGVQVGRASPPVDRVPATVNGPKGQGVQVSRASLPHDKRPRIPDQPGGRGVSADRADLPGDGIPFVNHQHGGQGVQAGRARPYGRDYGAPGDGVPEMRGWPGATGVSVTRAQIDTDGIGSGERLLPWFRSLAQRLARVTVLNRDWTSALTPTVLMDTPAHGGFVQAVFLDPPYLFNDRSAAIYASDASGETPARAAYDWAVAHGARYRVAYCAHADDFPLPDGWWATESRLSARKRDVRNETIYFSPACLRIHQPAML